MSFLRMLWTWLDTVLVVKWSWCAIFFLLMPFEIIVKILVLERAVPPDAKKPR